MRCIYGNYFISYEVPYAPHVDPKTQIGDKWELDVLYSYLEKGVEQSVHLLLHPFLQSFVFLSRFLGHLAKMAMMEGSNMHSHKLTVDRSETAGKKSYLSIWASESIGGTFSEVLTMHITAFHHCHLCQMPQLKSAHQKNETVKKGMQQEMQSRFDSFFQV